MDVRAGLNDHYASPAGAVTREKQFKGRRDAKKKAYAADAPARAARAEARAAEEQALAEARAKGLSREEKISDGASRRSGARVVDVFTCDVA